MRVTPEEDEETALLKARLGMRKATSAAMGNLEGLRYKVKAMVLVLAEETNGEPRRQRRAKNL
jgi:hypothetical protein